MSGVARLPRAVVERDGERAIETAADYAWRSWFRELHRNNLRPCGWPAVQRTYLAHAYLTAVDDARPFVEVDPDGEWHELHVAVTCEAVPA